VDSHYVQRLGQRLQKRNLADVWAHFSDFPNAGFRWPKRCGVNPHLGASAHKGFGVLMRALSKDSDRQNVSEGLSVSLFRLLSIHDFCCHQNSLVYFTRLLIKIDKCTQPTTHCAILLMFPGYLILCWLGCYMPWVTMTP
jgi:hypothetical protein